MKKTKSQQRNRKYKEESCGNFRTEKCNKIKKMMGSTAE